MPLRKIPNLPHFLVVQAGVRYWEDASVNGREDSNGDMIPFRDFGLWVPVIDLDTGQVIDWPFGTVADIHYKVCDAGEYFLADAEKSVIAKWKGHYVPDAFLCMGENGYGDYIIMRIDETGMIEGWEKPKIDWDEWDLV